MSNRQLSFLGTPVYRVGTLSNSNSLGDTYSIYSNIDVYIGRDTTRCGYVVDDPLVSNQHIRIYTIIFDRENLEISPLVYAQDLSLNGTLWNGHPMGKGNGSFLLSDGDVLTLSPRVSLQFNCEDHTQSIPFSELQILEMRVFAHQYMVTPKSLGSGAHGKVHMAYKMDTGRQLACKIIDIHSPKFRAIKEIYHAFDREIRISSQLCHPNIIGVEKTIRSNNTIYIFQELVTGGDLFSYFHYKDGKLEDIQVAVIVRQITMALDYLHDQNIVHRDLKPDNILMTSLADGCRVVLTDFGCARKIEPTNERMYTLVGTFEYNAPEIFNAHKQGYTKAVDLWSLGSVTTVLLTGNVPFQGSRTKGFTELAQIADEERLEADMTRNQTGPRARDFVRKLLVRNEADRMDVKQALAHEWFTNPSHRDEFEALYGRTIADWTPPIHEQPLIIHLADLKPSEGVEESTESDEFSAFDSGGLVDIGGLPSSLSTIDFGAHRDLPASLSQTLSDPNLPPLKRGGNTDANPPLHGQQPGCQEHFCLNMTEITTGEEEDLWDDFRESDPAQDVHQSDT
ncbi:kinase-like domain-containing protein [Aspergillus avenaceus]|uniref:Kinase-like domain-containing protein n=1 Tax=Aspergillus avenaceus TaxID=36643 RepID=A0A5N6TQG0_ASPAV|nr:kinase-like domain-containing protein [Aspergillus avenaceus]